MPTGRGSAGFGCLVRMRLAVVPKTEATFRVTVDLSQKAKEAILLLATRGDFVAKVNGHEVDAKGRWTTFDRRDISDELVVGKNEIEVTVTAPEAPEFGPNKAAPTTVAGLAALVKITSNNGTIQRFPTNANWKASLAKASDWESAHVVAELADKRVGDPGRAAAARRVPSPNPRTLKEREKRETLRHCLGKLPCVSQRYSRRRGCLDSRLY